MLWPSDVAATLCLVFFLRSCQEVGAALTRLGFNQTVGYVDAEKARPDPICLLLMQSIHPVDGARQSRPHFAGAASWSHAELDAPPRLSYGPFWMDHIIAQHSKSPSMPWKGHLSGNCSKP
jgi:hypothetical protein